MPFDNNKTIIVADIGFKEAELEGGGVTFTMLF